MNYRGSYRRLLENSISAILGAIEIYNKPRFSYRDEVFVILLMNAWELLLKAVVSKGGGSIYYRKRRAEPYRTLSWNHALNRAINSGLWPSDVEVVGVEANLDLLANYRDSAVHFYNNRGFGAVVYLLAQTSVVNFRDVAVGVFGKDIAAEITWRIVPLGAANPVDPIEFLQGKTDGKRSRAVQDFLAYLKQKSTALELEGIPSNRLITGFDVSMQSVKKVTNADIVVGLGVEGVDEPVVISRRVDPNKSHPLRLKDVLPLLRKRTSRFSTHTFQAVVFRYELKGNPQYCWRDESVLLTKWSREIVAYIDALSDDELASSVRMYSAALRARKAKSV